MLIETGAVVAVDSDAVWVETLRRSTCGSCAVQGGCGHGLLNRLGAGGRHCIRVLPGKLRPEQCRVGDRVSIGLPESVVLKGSALVYLLPLLAMLAGAAVAGSAWPGMQDLAALIGAAAGFGLGIIVVRVYTHRHRDDPALQPTLLSLDAAAVVAAAGPHQPATR